jgi:hypothetical protein
MLRRISFRVAVASAALAAPGGCVHVSVRGRTRARRRGRRANFYSRIRVQLDGQPPAQWLALYVPRKRRC